MAAASPETTSSSCSVAYAGPHTRVTLYLCVPESVCVREQCMCASIRCEAQTRNRRLCFLSLNPGYFADKSERLRQRIHGPASGCVVDDLEEQFGQRIGGMIRASLLEEYDAEEKAELRRRLATTSNGIEIEEEEHIFVSQSEVVELHQVTAPANGGSTNDSHCPDVEIDDTTLRRQIMEKFLAGFDVCPLS